MKSPAKRRKVSGQGRGVGSREPALANTNFIIVGIGASAGGLEAFTLLLSHLPKNTGMAFVLVQHLDPVHASQLTNLLAKATAMPVLEVKDGMPVRPDQVFVIPPNVNMRITGGRLKLTPREEPHAPHLPVDFLFRSLAMEQQSWAVGVILSGNGSDGTLGLEAIKNAGGLTFVQDEKSAKFSGMPLSAARRGVDFILPPEKIAEELGRIRHDPYLAHPAKVDQDEPPAASKEFQRILAILRAHTNVDLRQYRDGTIMRRIQRRMLVHACDSLGDYLGFLDKNKGEIRALFDDVLINVTRFFRDPEMFEALRTEVFPEILKTASRVIRIWVTACATGQEAYSMAIALLEFLENKPSPPVIQIFATDVNETVAIEPARRGSFPKSIEGELSPERLRRHFIKEADGYRIKKELRDLCVFARQNLVAEPPFSRMDLITCRNLLIYFTPELQRQVIATFHYALNPGGFLVLGSSETVGAHADMFEVRDRKHKIFSKKGMAMRPFAHFTAEDLKRGPLVTPRDTPAHPPGSADFQKEADRILLGRFAPAAVLVSNSLDVLQFRGRTSPYLEPPAGPASFNLLKMARDNLALELGRLIQESRRQNAPVSRPVHFHDRDIVRKINLEVVPVRLPGSSENCLLVLFEESGTEAVESEKLRRRKQRVIDVKRPAAEKDLEVDRLRSDLAAAREYLQSVIEQHDASNEELKCANEEVLSSNEELQSTNEQLSTAKEELQSTNEELVTLNEELQTRLAELTQINKDLEIAHHKLLDEKSARQTAESASHAKDVFLATLSHELRTPLNPVLLLASEAALDADLSPRTRANFDLIRKSIELEARLIDDLLDITRVNNDKLELKVGAVDIHGVLQDAISTVQNDITQKQIELALDLKAQNPVVLGDAVRLQQVFWNVLSNAVKFTPSGGKVFVTTAAAGGKFQALIRDTGVGMAKEESGHIFEVFSQGSKAAALGGLGLGLAISRKLIELHNGTIHTLSEGAEKGTTFTIELPLAQLKKPVSSESPADPAPRTPVKKGRPPIRILLVEDHEGTRSALVQLLLRRNYKVTTAISLREALALGEREEFDLVVSDIGLPDGSGIEVMQAFKKLGVAGIALTGYGMPDDVARSQQAGFKSHLTKPIKIQALDAALADVLGNR